MSDESAQAVQIAEKHMASQGYSHGPCLGVNRRLYKAGVYWEVELAHPGYTRRSDTADPPSIQLLVHVPTETVTDFMEMWGK